MVFYFTRFFLYYSIQGRSTSRISIMGNPSAHSSGRAAARSRSWQAGVDARAMAYAFAVARRGCPAPNPHVGAIVLKGSQVVGVGHHERAGGPHAEVAALMEAGESAREATLYVTLEPCNHIGRTDPCVDAILTAGIVRVVVGCRDPNPFVCGGGASRLAASGVEVVFGAWQAKAETLIRPWRERLGGR